MCERRRHRLAGVGAQGGIEGREGLVEKHQRRVRRERARKRHPLLLAAGKLLGTPSGVRPRQSDELEQFVDPPSLAPQLPRQSEGDIVGDIEVGEKGAFLRDIADASPLGRNMRFCSGDNGAPNADAALVQPSRSRRCIAAASSCRCRKHRESPAVRPTRLSGRGRAARASAKRLGQPADCELGHCGKAARHWRRRTRPRLRSVERGARSRRAKSRPSPPRKARPPRRRA